MKQDYYEDVILSMSKEEDIADVGGEAPETDDEEADA